MPRRPAASVATALAALTAMLLAAGGVTSTGSTLRDPGSTIQATGSAGQARTVSTGSTAPARTPYQQQLFDARQSRVSLGPVVGARDRPNVVVLMTDDMRDDDLQFMPNVQRLIGDRGVRFTNTFSPQPLCCPARASFFTGLLSHNHGVWSHKPPYGFRVFDDRQTLPRWLHENGGYDTAFVGKYLNGYGRQRLRDGSSSLRYVPPGWTDWRAAVDQAREDIEATHLHGGTYRFFDTTLNDNGVLEPHQGVYQTNLYSDITQEVIRREARSARPFFLQTAFSAPHLGKPTEDDDPEPYARSDGYLQGWQNPARPGYVKGRFDHVITRLAPWIDGEDVAGKPVFIRRQPPLTREERDAILEDYRQRAESLSVVDDEVANIIATLRRTGELDNTYVIFTSDNGVFLGEHRRRLGKILPYDPALRVPLVMRGPGLPRGEERTDPFLMTDFAPTILEATGVAGRRPMDGVSMLDVARFGDRGWTRPILTESGPRRLTDDNLARVRLLERERGPSSLRFSQGVRTGHYLYVEHASRERELYDLRRDPRQLVNVVDRHRYRGVVRLLARELDRLRDCRGAACSAPLPRRLRTEHPVPPASFDPAGPRTAAADPA